MKEKKHGSSEIRKYKFLVPQIINFLFVIIIYSLAKFDANCIVIVLMSSIIAIALSIHLFRFEFFDKYREESLLRDEKNKNLPMEERILYKYHLSQDLEILTFLGMLLLIGVIIYALIKNEFGGVLVLSIVILLSYFITKILKKIFFKKIIKNQ